MILPDKTNVQRHIIRVLRREGYKTMEDLSIEDELQEAIYQLWSTCEWEVFKKKMSRIIDAAIIHEAYRKEEKNARQLENQKI